MAALSWLGPVGTTPQDQLPALDQSPVLGVQVQLDPASADCIGAADITRKAASAREFRANGLRVIDMCVLRVVIGAGSCARVEPWRDCEEPQQAVTERS